MKTYRIAATTLLIACSNNPSVPTDGGDVDAPPTISLDAAPDAPLDAAPDAEPLPACAVPQAGTIGGACDSGMPCEAPADGSAGLFMFCLDAVAAAPAWPESGFCTAFFCAADADCGAGNVCGALPDGFGGTFTACLPACCDEAAPGEACSNERVCAQSLFGDQLGGVSACIPGTPTKADGDRCAEFADCEIDSVCRRDPFQFPGGQCATVKCSDDNDCAPGGDGRCVTLENNGGDICVDDCQTDSDCRHLEGYRCMDRQDGNGTFCQRAQPGDPCGSLFDCGSVGDAWDCKLGNDYPGGYCTVPNCDINDNNTCPVASFCVNLQDEVENFCADQCPTVGGNECGAGYQCVEVSPPDAGGSGRRNVCIPAAGTVEMPL